MPTSVIQAGPIGIRFLVEGRESNGSVAVFEALIPPNANMPVPHSHDGYEETVYGLAGTSTWTVDGDTSEISEGDVICIPRGAIHGFDNRGETDAKVLGVVTPGILGPDFFREISAVFVEAAGGPPDFAKLGEVMRRHGLTPEPPAA